MTIPVHDREIFHFGKMIDAQLPRVRDTAVIEIHFGALLMSSSTATHFREAARSKALPNFFA
jgi:hypothetical protein